MASHFEQTEHGLTSELVDNIERTGAVRRTSIIAQVHVVVLGEALTDSMKDGKSAVAAIEDANGPWILREGHF
jgi:hypothetical protein